MLIYSRPKITKCLFPATDIMALDFSWSPNLCPKRCYLILTKPLILVSIIRTFLQINLYDQPGVENGKKILKRILND